ncbi:calcyclin-binding protein-like isoform X2 [Gigantopelta aegis]|uniref:calcyclin-binding protein-like isoform X2 n=1 Tax=Gigantopelta aegis TaxID=1735272 RepID=UPI001B887BE3|nr:calcyclin-binding protein-like isoform X2 [Gigantopelta aegis]
MSSVEEIKKDVEEIKKFIGEASRTRVRDILELELHKLEFQLYQKTGNSEYEHSKPDTVTGTTTVVGRGPQIFTEKITNYAWDQSDKFMKLYVTLSGVQSIPGENVTSKFTEKSVELHIKNLNNKNYELYITKVCESIDASASYHKVKTDMVLLMLKKKDTGKAWAYVTEAEKKAKETKKPPIDEKDDPNASIMKLMQNMYEEGDDEMKRTISKAWSESRDKQPSF